MCGTQKALRTTMAKRAASFASPASQFKGSELLVVIHGTEEMRKREYFVGLIAALKKNKGELDIITMDGKSTSLADVLDEVRSFSLMQQHKLVVVDNGDVFVSAHREALERYAASPVDNGTLLLRSDKWYPGKFDKLVDKVGAVVKCQAMDSRELGPWIVDRAAKRHGVKIDPRAVDALIRRLGADLMLIDSELGKLAVMAGAPPLTPGEEQTPGPDAPTIQAKLVEDVVGRAGDEEAWAVKEAILSALASPSNAGLGKALEQVHEMIDVSGQPDVLVQYFVADLMRELYLAGWMKRQGVPESDIAREVKLWGPRQATFFTVLRKLTPRSAATLFDRIVDADVRSKTGRGDATRNLEGFFALFSEQWAG
jgi:DNA polymerase-3 subunit delta